MTKVIRQNITINDTTITKNLTYRYDASDDQGNWIQRTEMEKGKPTKVEKRTITYAKKE